MVPGLTYLGDVTMASELLPAADLQARLYEREMSDGRVHYLVIHIFPKTPENKIPVFQGYGLTPLDACESLVASIWEAKESSETDQYIRLTLESITELRISQN